MFPFLLHWYILFGIIWNVQSRDALAKNSVQSYTVWITSGDRPKREKTIFLDHYGDIVSIHYPISTTSERVDTFMYSYSTDGKILNTAFRDISVRYNWNGSSLLSKDEFTKDQKIQVSHTDYKNGANTLLAITSIEDGGPVVVIKDTTDISNHTISEFHYSGHDFYGNTVYTYDNSGRILTMEISHPGSPGKETHQYQYNEKGLVTGETTYLPGKSSPEVKSYEYVYF
jgi:hypothetical protein